jgi:hypothetical protein
MIKSRAALLIGLLLVLSGVAKAQSSSSATPPGRSGPNLTYNQIIGSGYSLLKEARLSEAYLAAMEGARKEPARFEAYALAALVLHARGDDMEAKPFVDKALALAPANRKRLLNELAGQITSGLATASKAPSPDPDLRRKQEALRQIIADADKAATPEQRRAYLREFLTKSEPVISQSPGDVRVWLLRGVAAAEIDDPKEGRQAACQLKRLGQDRSQNENASRVLAVLDRKGWFYGSGLDVQSLISDATRTLKANGPLKGSWRERDSEGTQTAEASVSYGDIGGSCATGFDIAVVETDRTRFRPGVNNNAKAHEENATLSATLHVDVLDSKFYSRFRYDDTWTMNYWFALPQPSPRDKRMRMVTTVDNGAPTTKDGVPDDTDFERFDDRSGTISELLNRLHWACVCQR